MPVSVPTLTRTRAAAPRTQGGGGQRVVVRTKLPRFDSRYTAVLESPPGSVLATSVHGVGEYFTAAGELSEPRVAAHVAAELLPAIAELRAKKGQ